MVDPVHTAPGPEIAGASYTVTVAVDVPQTPVAEITAVPGVTPVTVPKVAGTLAMLALLLLHVAVPVVLESAVVAPAQRLRLPVSGKLLFTLIEVVT
jgi:hypothetical protein